jgi:hypothetical protein
MVGACGIGRRKVGRTLTEAIFAKPDRIKFSVKLIEPLDDVGPHGYPEALKP